MTEFSNTETRPKKRKPARCLVITIVLVVVIFLVVYGLQGLVSSISGKISSVAVLSIEGAIYNVKEELEQLNKYRDNPGVKAIVLKIDSPGGSVGAVQELYSELLKLKAEQKKPIVAAMGNIAASGGYYIACAADEIITNPGTITGSIGVIMTFPNWEELIRKLGINMEVVKSGKFKDIGSPTRPMTPEEQKLLSEVINDVYEQFFDAVYTARRQKIKERLLTRVDCKSGDSSTTGTLTEDAVKEQLREIADGRIFSGRQALEYGLVDKLGTLEDAIKRAGELAKIKGQPHIIKPRRRLSFWDLLSGKVFSFKHIPLYDSPRLEYLL